MFMLLSNSKRIIIGSKSFNVKKKERGRSVDRAGMTPKQIAQCKIQRKQTAGHES